MPIRISFGRGVHTARRRRLDRHAARLTLTGGAGVRAMTRVFSDLFSIDDGFAGIQVAGRTDRGILQSALLRHGLDPDAAMVDAFRARYCRLLETEIQTDGPRKRVLPGVRELLDALSGRDGIVVGLLTGNFAEGARIKLEHFDLWRYSACGAFGDDAADRNELVPIAIDRVRMICGPAIPPEQVSVIGDTTHDVACARAGGARAIAVATGFDDLATLQASGADVVLTDFSDTTQVLKLLE
jgi:phosphoglycolate phosphatase-like HAD superfamily hydrolase